MRAVSDVVEMPADAAVTADRAGAMGVAAMKHYVARHGMRDETLVAITCGANVNFDRLRFVAERAEVGEEREALFAVTIPETRGSFRQLCAAIGPASARLVIQ